MKTLLDIENWNRKEHFHFFNKFEEPFWGATVDVECTNAYKICKENGFSFFLYYLHSSLLAANKIESFRYRILNDQVFIYDKIDASPTINRENGTFGFGYMPFDENFLTFQESARQEIIRVKSSTELIPATSGENVIHYSSLPWIKFTSMSHARSYSFPDSCPKITFGKLTEQGDKKVLPISIHVHHALVDGYHVGLFIEEFQTILNPNFSR